MTKKLIMRITAGKPPADQETEKKFNKWLDEEHLPALFKFKKAKTATNYDLLDEEKYRKDYQKTSVEYPRTITVFEFDNEEDFEEFETSVEKAEARKRAQGKWGNDIGTHVWWVVYKARTTLKR